MFICANTPPIIRHPNVSYQKRVTIGVSDSVGMVFPRHSQITHSTKPGFGHVVLPMLKCIMWENHNGILCKSKNVDKGQNPSMFKYQRYSRVYILHTYPRQFQQPPFPHLSSLLATSNIHTDGIAFLCRFRLHVLELMLAETTFLMLCPHEQADLMGPRTRRVLSLLASSLSASSEVGPSPW